MKHTFPIVIIFSLLLISCGNGKVFEKYNDINNNKWNREEPIDFSVNIEDASCNYDVLITVRHTVYYMYSDLLISATVLYPNGEIRIKDHTLNLRDSKGTFMGQGMGDIFDIEIPLMKNVKFPTPGSYLFKIQNIMPRPETANIMQIGLIVKKTEK